MRSEKVPFRRTLFVCTHSRPEGERASCGNPGRGGVETLAALKEAAEKAGLKGKVRIARSGCLDLCEKGPNAFLYPDGEWLSGLTPADAESVVRKLTP